MYLCKISDTITLTGFPLDFPSVKVTKRGLRRHLNAGPAASDEPCHGSPHDPGVSRRRVASTSRHATTPENVHRWNASCNGICFGGNSTNWHRGTELKTVRVNVSQLSSFPRGISVSQ